MRTTRGAGHENLERIDLCRDCRSTWHFAKHRGITLPLRAGGFEERASAQMNDFSEIENELRKLRPAQPSPILFERIEEAMMNCREGAWSARQSRKPSPYNWLSLGFGLAAAAALVLFAAISMEHQRDGGKEIAQISRESETAPLRSSAKESTSS